MSSGAKPKDVKKTGRYVPSRYMQAIEKVSVNSSSREETKRKISKEARGFQISRNSSQDISNTSESSVGMTSTPTYKGGFPLPILDASAVTDCQGHLTVPTLKERIVPATVDSIRRNRIKSKRPLDETILPHGPVISQKDKKRDDAFNERIASAELDILYATYLQAAFLESEAEKSLETRSKTALETLHRLSSLVLQHLYKAKTQKVSLRIISFLIEVHKHCAKQEDMLKPVFEVIPALEEQYRCLSEAVGITKHKLPIKDVILPDSDCEGEVLEILQKMNGFLSSFFEALPNYQDIISSCDVLKNYLDAGELITDALKRCMNLLIEAHELCFTEAEFMLGCKDL